MQMHLVKIKEQKIDLSSKQKHTVSYFFGAKE